MLMSNLLVPNSHEHLDNFKSFLETKTPFSFVRFSDGEIEILRNIKNEHVVRSFRTF